MCGKKQWQLMFSGQSEKSIEQHSQAGGIVNILFTMCADDEIRFTLDPMALSRIRCADAVAKALQDFAHRRAYLDYRIRPYALRKQIPARVLGVWKIDIADVIDNAPVDLFRNTSVKTTISRFHVKNGDMAPLGGNHTKTGICIA